MDKQLKIQHPKKHIFSILFFLLILSCPLFSLISTASETSIGLSGKWKLFETKTSTLPRKDTNWQTVTVPGYITGNWYPYAWYKKNFTLPEKKNGKADKVFIAFEAVKWSSEVFINGNSAGTHSGGFTPFEFDITPYIKFGEENEILVKVSNISSIREENTRKFLYPPGWHKDINLHGIWGNVSIEIRPYLHIKNLSLFTFVKSKTITISAMIVNYSDTSATANLTFSVKDKSDLVLNFKNNPETIGPGKIKKITARAKWQSPKLWSPQSPFLYELESILSSDDKIIDKKKTKFGFREFSISGNQFFLNGKKIHLFGTCFHIADVFDNLDAGSPERTFSLLKYANINVVRLMDQPWPEHWYDTADRMGMLIIADSAITPDGSQKISDPRYWENASAHISSYVQDKTNHPSIIIWNLSSEIDSMLAQNKDVKKSELENRMIRLKYDVSSIDPVRPTMNEGARDFGNADIENIHYPREYVYDLNMGGWHYQYPNAGFWFRLDKKGALRKNPAIPYYIGETLWSASRTPDGDTVFTGDKAYVNFLHFKQIAKSKALLSQMKAYRMTNMPGVSPWNIFEEKFWGNSWKDKHIPEKNPLIEACRKAFAPVVAFVKEYNGRFFSDSLLKRTIYVLNDSLSDKFLRAKISLLLDGKTLEETEKSFFIKTGGKNLINASFKLPETRIQKEFFLKISLSDERKELFSDSIKYTLFPKLEKSNFPKDKIMVFDPSQSLSFLAMEAFEYLNGQSLDDLPSDKILIVGENAFNEPLTDNSKRAQAISRFIQKGGKALILKQKTLPPEIYPVKKSNHTPTMVYIRSKGHPVFSGMKNDSLSFWQGNNFVAEDCYLKPEKGRVRALADSGGKGGLLYTPLIECFKGDGLFILCQMNIASKYNVEPSAGMLFKNIVDYLLSLSIKKTSADNIFLINGGDNFLKKIKRLTNLNPRDLRGKTLSSLINEKALFLADFGKEKNVNIPQSILEGVKSGSTLYIHSLTPRIIDRVNNMLGLNISLEKPIHLPPFVISRNPSLWGISNQELYWTIDKQGLAQHPTPLRREIITFAADIADSSDIKDKYAIPLENTECDKKAEFKEDRIYLKNNSSLVFDIDSKSDYTAIIDLNIESSNSGKKELLFSIKDSYFPKGKLIAIKSIAANSKINSVVTVIPLIKGTNRISIKYRTDIKNSPFVISAISYSPMEENSGLLPLIFPSGLVKMQLGKGNIIIDQLRWKTLPDTSPEIKKAERYLSTLFTNLIYKTSL